MDRTFALDVDNLGLGPQITCVPSEHCYKWPQEPNGGQSDNIAGRWFALHSADPGLIFGIPYGPL